MRDEVRKAFWFPLDKAHRKLTYRGEREVLKMAQKIVREHPERLTPPPPKVVASGPSVPRPVAQQRSASERANWTPRPPVPSRGGAGNAGSSRAGSARGGQRGVAPNGGAQRSAQQSAQPPSSQTHPPQSNSSQPRSGQSRSPQPRPAPRGNESRPPARGKDGHNSTSREARPLSERGPGRTGRP
jgi:hypothetical protein